MAELPPSYEDAVQAATPPDEPMAALRRVATKYELANGSIARLRVLERYNIVLIVDDSSSMLSPAHDPPASDPFRKMPSRWDELKDRLKQIVEIAVCLDRDGVDVYFLNRPPVFGVDTPEKLAQLFHQPPEGYTPLAAAYRRVLNENLGGDAAQILIIIATDGAPNKVDKRGTCRGDLDGFVKALKSRDAPRTPTSIMACTDSEHEIGWLNSLDDSIPFLDVVDDYLKEKQEVKKVQDFMYPFPGGFPFSRGDYMVKTLLGSVDPLYDRLDETRLSREHLAAYLGESLDRIPRRSVCEGAGCAIL